MTLADKIRDEIELSDFYADRNAAANIIAIFRTWGNRNLIDSSEMVELLNVEWREAQKGR